LPVLFFMLSGQLFCQTKEDSIKKIIDQTEFASVVEVQASFKGDREGLKKFISTNLKIPQKVKEEKIKGKTFLKLGILADGTALVLEILKPLDGCPECDQAALELIKIMPKWSPAKMDGKIVPCYWNLPIEFSYENK
jgi:protein TonB